MRTFAVLASTIAAIVTMLALASTASADRLCSIATTPCPNVNTYIGSSFLTGDLKFGTSLTLSTAGGMMNPIITCARSSYSLTTLNSGDGEAAEVSFTLNSLLLLNCTSMAPTGCSVSGVQGNLPTFGWVGWETGSNGFLHVIAPTITFGCIYLGFPLTCQLSSTELTASVTGGTSAEVEFVTQSIWRPGNVSSLCPQSGILSATYTTTEPLFVTQS